MARAKIDVVKMGWNTPVETDAKAVSKNHMEVDVSNMGQHRLIFKLVGGGAKYIATFKAGDFSDKALGDLAIEVDTTDEKVVSVETSRFGRADGTIYINITSDDTPTGTIEAYLLP